MGRENITPTGRERSFSADEIIVSKTDPKGRITYANDVFLQVSGFTEAELMGQPHSIVRHPDMPRCVYKLLWETIQGGREIFAYVKNLAKNGDYYWVFAHVTPNFDANGQIVGYHSNRRCPAKEAVEKVEPVYRQLLEAERCHGGRDEGMSAATAVLLKMIGDSGLGSYERFIFHLAKAARQ